MHLVSNNALLCYPAVSTDAQTATVNVISCNDQPL